MVEYPCWTGLQSPEVKKYVHIYYIRDFVQLNGCGHGLESCKVWICSLSTVPKVIDFPRFNLKCSEENQIQHGIFQVVSRFPLHFMLYRGNLDYFLDSVRPHCGEDPGRDSNPGRVVQSRGKDTVRQTITCISINTVLKKVIGRG